MRTAEAQKALFARCISTSSGQYGNAGLGRAAEIRSQNGIWSTNNLPTCLSPFSHLGFRWREASLSLTMPDIKWCQPGAGRANSNWQGTNTWEVSKPVKPSRL